MKVRDIIENHKQGYYKPGKFENGNIHFVRISDINDDAFLDLDNTPMINVEANIIEKFQIKKNDFLFARTGGAGRFCLVKENINGIFASYLIRFRLNNNFNSNFMRYFFLSDSFQNELKSKIHGGVNQNVHAENIKDCKVPNLSLPEQKRIVKILDKAFEAIDKAKSNAEKNLKNSREIFESYLNEVFEKKGDDWEEKKLKDIALDFSRGKSKHRPRNWKGLFDGKYPFIQTGEVRNANKYITSYTKTYNEVGLAQSKFWKKGTICITIAANIAETAILSFDACFPDSIIGLLTDPMIASTDFTYYLLQFYKKDLQKLGKGSAQDNINLGTFEKEVFLFPQIKEQKQIVKKLDKLSTESEKLEKIYQKKIDDLEELKKSILQKAFEGEL